MKAAPVAQTCLQWQSKQTPPLELTWPNSMHPQCCVDINQKEWLVFLRRYDTNVDTQNPSNVNGASGYLYDTKNDKFIVFIENYRKYLNNQQQIRNTSNNSKKIQNDKIYFDSFVIDNHHHILYILDSSPQGIQNGKKFSIIKFGIKDLNNIKFIDRIFFKRQLKFCDKNKINTGYVFPQFSIHFQMFAIGKDIHMINNGANYCGQHYVFDTNKNNLTLLDDCILRQQKSACNERYFYLMQDQLKQIKYLKENGIIKRQKSDQVDLVAKTNNSTMSTNGLGIGDMIDVRATTKRGIYHLATIMDVKPKGENIIKDKILIKHIADGKFDKSYLEKGKQLKGILIHLHTFQAAKTYEHNRWMYIDDEKPSIFCNCIGACQTTKKFHRIAAPNTQSKIEQQFYTNPRYFLTDAAIKIDKYNRFSSSYRYKQNYNNNNNNNTDSNSDDNKNDNNNNCDDIPSVDSECEIYQGVGCVSQSYSWFNRYHRHENKNERKILVCGYIRGLEKRIQLQCVNDASVDTCMTMPLELWDIIFEYYFKKPQYWCTARPISNYDCQIDKVSSFIWIEDGKSFVIFDESNGIFKADIEKGTSQVISNQAIVDQFELEYDDQPLKIQAVLARQSNTVHLFDKPYWENYLNHRCVSLSQLVQPKSTN